MAHHMVKSLLIGGLLVFSAVPVWAHKPTYSSDDYASPSTAFVIQDLDVSIVVKDEVTCEFPELWLTFENAVPGRSVYVSLLTPYMDALADFRPSLAVIAPGLPPPPASFPLAIGAGSGALIIDTSDVEPEIFYEQFSKRESRVLFEDWISLPQAGTGYIVAWDPLGQEGRLSVAVGTVEDFGPADWAKMPEWSAKGRIFHDRPVPSDSGNLRTCDS